MNLKIEGQQMKDLNHLDYKSFCIYQSTQTNIQTSDYVTLINRNINQYK